VPRSLEPNSKITFVLACDVDKPKETQPRLFGKSLTISQARRLESSILAMKTSEVNRLETIVDVAMICLSGWENMIDPSTGEAIPFSRENVENVLSMDELSEIIEATASDGRLSNDDQKKSESPL
jgi:hypothetical protein